MKYKDAIIYDKLEEFINSSSERQISTISYDLERFLIEWLGEPTLERIKDLQNAFPYLNHFIDFKIIINRFNKIKNLHNKNKSQNSTHIAEVLPELEIVFGRFDDFINKLDSGIKKAELRLYPFAINAGADANMEAALYFAGQGEILLDPLDIKNIWHRGICKNIEIGNCECIPSFEEQERAKSISISLNEASEILKFNGRLRRFFSYYDSETDFIDATFFRAVEWFDVKGFEPWIESIANDYSEILINGTEQIYISWSLFYWCRSDYALKKFSRQSLESLFFVLTNGTIEINKPWRISWFNNVINSTFRVTIKP